MCGSCYFSNNLALWKFSAPLVDWMKGRNTNLFGRVHFQLISDIIQQVNESSRYQAGCSPSFLGSDIFDENHQYTANVRNPLGNSGHIYLLFDFLPYRPTSSSECRSLSPFRRVDFREMSDHPSTTDHKLEDERGSLNLSVVSCSKQADYLLAHRKTMSQQSKAYVIASIRCLPVGHSKWFSSSGSTGLESNECESKHMCSLCKTRMRLLHVSTKTDPP